MSGVINTRADQHFYTKNAVINGKLNLYGVDIYNNNQNELGAFYITAILALC